MVRPNTGSVPQRSLQKAQDVAPLGFTGTYYGRIGAPAVAGIGAPSVRFSRARLSSMTGTSRDISCGKKEIDSESSEVTVHTCMYLDAMRYVHTPTRDCCVPRFGCAPIAPLCISLRGRPHTRALPPQILSVLLAPSGERTLRGVNSNGPNTEGVNKTVNTSGVK